MLGNDADKFMTTPMRTTVVTQNTARQGEMPAPRPGAHNSATKVAATVRHPSAPTRGMLPGMAGTDFLPGMQGTDFLPGMQGIGFLDTLSPTQKVLGGAAIIGAVLWFTPLGKTLGIRK